MLNIGINGFGRIGKCVFHQLIDNKHIKIKTMNVPRLFVDNLDEYINYDSVHHIKKRNLEYAKEKEREDQEKRDRKKKRR